MVKIVDGYKKRKEALNRHRTLAELAKKSFNGQVDYIDYESNTRMIVREGSTGCDVEIHPAGFIDVHKKSYFESAKRFAEEAEKVMGIEFILSTTYEL